MTDAKRENERATYASAYNQVRLARAYTRGWDDGNEFARSYTALKSNSAWKDFRCWVKESVRFEGKLVSDFLEDSRLDKHLGRREGYEDVWQMILAFERSGDAPKEEESDAKK